MSLTIKKNWGTVLCLIVGTAAVWCNIGPSVFSAESVFAGYSGAGSCNCGIENTSCSGCSSTRTVCSAGRGFGTCQEKSGIGSTACVMPSCDPSGVKNMECR